MFEKYSSPHQIKNCTTTTLRVESFPKQTKGKEIEIISWKVPTNDFYFRVAMHQEKRTSETKSFKNFPRYDVSVFVPTEIFS